MKGFQSPRTKGKSWCYKPCPLRWTKFHASHSRALPNLDSSHISHIWCFPSCFPLGGVCSQRRIIKTFQPHFPAAFWPFSLEGREILSKVFIEASSCVLPQSKVTGLSSHPSTDLASQNWCCPSHNLSLNSQWSFGLNLQTGLCVADVKCENRSPHAHRKTLNPLQSECADPLIALP